ncbi:unnamed protein product [Cochlearia groenlandica]
MTNKNIATNNPKLHVAMFPWLAFGHMIPHLELSKLISQKGHKVSFISTPLNIQRLLPRLSENLISSVDFVNIPLLPSKDLPGGCEATTDVPFHLVPYLKVAFDEMLVPVTEFLESSKPDWILLLIGFPPSVAASVSKPAFSALSPPPRSLF